MTRNCRTVVLTACAAVLIGVSSAHAQSPTALEQAEIKHPASQIVAMDWGKGVAVVQLPRGGMRAVHFDPTTLQIKG